MQTERDVVSFSLPDVARTSRMRYRKLGYVALNVSDLDRSRRFYEEMIGLQPSGEGEGVAFFRCSNDHHNIALFRSPQPGLRQIGWELEDDDTLDASFAELAKHDAPVRWLSNDEAGSLHVDRAFCVVDPTGIRHDFYSSMGEFAIDPFKPTVANILRIGHVVVKTDAYRAQLEFATKTLNFRVSDSVRDKITFMRPFPSPFHHGMGVINTDKRMLHHVNFMVESIDDVGRALARLNANDVTIVYGPGRHPPSDSIFVYFLEPDGMTLEFSFGMEQFPEQAPRKPRVFEPVAALDYWRSRQDPRLGSAGVISPEER